jgi:hypothetical protein
MTAARARSAAEELDAKVHLGGDPQGEKASARLRTQQTFRKTADAFLLFQEPALRPATLAATRRYLLAHARSLHNVDVKEITRPDVATLLARVEREHGPVAANRARSALSAMFSWAMCEGLTDVNPTVATTCERRRRGIACSPMTRFTQYGVRSNPTTTATSSGCSSSPASGAAKSAIFAGTKLTLITRRPRCRRAAPRITGRMRCRYLLRCSISSERGTACRFWGA